jgi:hypothetical protein
MAFEDFGARRSPFERLLEALDEEDPPLSEKGAFSGAERLWPRVFAAPLREAFHSGEAVEALYVEAIVPEHFSAPIKSVNADLTVQFAAIREQLARTRTLAELRQLRRHCALLLHPDRVTPPHRFLAENFMAEINAAIDRAIKGK